MTGHQTPKVSSLSRRRTLQMFGAVAGIASIPALRAGAHHDLPIHKWHGVALGAFASITLAHPNKRAAEKLFQQAESEIARLEAVFSLHVETSEVRRLNDTGRLDDASDDLRAVLTAANDVSERSRGAFDISVQPVWDLYARHFSDHPKAQNGPSDVALRAALAKVDYRAISVDRRAVRFGAPGMAITMNGIAQGYITDRVSDLMRAAGIDHVLLDLGEHRAVGAHPEHRPWRIGLADPDRPDHYGQTVDLEDQAVATSGGYGTRFSVDGAHHHLFDPTTGHSANAFRSVSVIAPTATLADALSTALFVQPAGDADDLVGSYDDVRALLTDRNDQTRVVGA